jgi:hypothetical protein
MAKVKMMIFTFVASACAALTLNPVAASPEVVFVKPIEERKPSCLPMSSIIMGCYFGKDSTFRFLDFKDNVVVTVVWDGDKYVITDNQKKNEQKIDLKKDKKK